MTELWEIKQAVEDAADCLAEALRKLHDFDFEGGPGETSDWPALREWADAIGKAETDVRSIAAPAEIVEAIRARDAEDREPIAPGDYHYYTGGG